MERSLIREHLGQMKAEGISEREEQLIRELMAALSAERNEGETIADFSKRVRGDARHILNIDM